MQERERKRLSLVLRATDRATAVIRRPDQDLERARVVAVRLHPDGWGGFFARVRVHDPERSSQAWTRTIQAEAGEAGFTKREARRRALEAVVALETPSDEELAGGAS